MNGSDMIEIIEDHLMEIENEFLKQFSIEQLRAFLLEDTSIDEIKEKNDFDKFSNEWAEQFKEVQKKNV